MRLALATADAAKPTKRKPSRAELRKAELNQRRIWSSARRAETGYRRALRGVAAQVGKLVDGLAPGGIVGDHWARIMSILERYAETIRPWAEAVGARMLEDVSKRDEAAWAKHSETIGRVLRKELRSAPTGNAMRGLLDEQVDLITSLPREAALRVQKLAIEEVTSGTRGEDIRKMIMRTGHVTASRAETIARTEVGRVTSVITQVRAEHVGSEAYEWDTAGDADVRKSHREMQGKIVRWDSPPTLDGLTGHAGALPNCRCIPIPILPRLGA